MTRKVNKNSTSASNLTLQQVVVKEEQDVVDYIVVGEVKDEDEEVAQLMQNYENLLGGLEMGQAHRDKIVTESSSPTHSTSRFRAQSGL